MATLIWSILVSIGKSILNALSKEFVSKLLSIFKLKKASDKKSKISCVELNQRTTYSITQDGKRSITTTKRVRYWFKNHK